MKTFDQDSEQVAKIRSADYTQLRPYDLYGRKRVCYGNVTADLAEDDVVGLIKIPRDCRVLPSLLAHTAFGTGVTAEIGVAAQDGSGFIDKAGTIADDDDFFATGVDVSAAGNELFADTVAGNLGYIFEKDVIITITLESANPAAGTLVGVAEIAND